MDKLKLLEDFIRAIKGFLEKDFCDNYDKGQIKGLETVLEKIEALKNL